MKDLYKCPSCGATDYDDDLYEHEVGDGYVCNNCIDGIMILQKPDKPIFERLQELVEKSKYTFGMHVDYSQIIKDIRILEESKK